MYLVLIEKQSGWRERFVPVARCKDDLAHGTEQRLVPGDGIEPSRPVRASGF